VVRLVPLAPSVPWWLSMPYRGDVFSLPPASSAAGLNVGIGEDKTLARVQEFSAQEGMGKIKIFESDWQLDQPEKRKSGLILSEQTNLVLDRCTHNWCIYIQADEVLHEADYSVIKSAIAGADSRPEVEGILSDYVHFYGSFDIEQKSRSAYRREVRIIRRSSGARSVGDAQSFRKPDGSKLQVIRPGCRILHYGWVRPPEAMKEKTFFMDTLYHGSPNASDEESRTPHTGNNYKYKRIPGLRRFSGTHPQVMQGRIHSKNWNWDFENSSRVFTVQDLRKGALDWIERMTGLRLFEYRSYRLIK